MKLGKGRGNGNGNGNGLREKKNREGSVGRKALKQAAFMAFRGEQVKKHSPPTGRD